jgi:ABC-type polysaccharide/polyol phosphate export permease
MATLLKDIYNRRELLWILVVRNLKIRYKNSVLGFFWSLLIPVFLILIYAVFAHLLRFSGGDPHYLQFLIIGIVCWQFLVMCLNDSLAAIMGNANLVKKTTFPRFILPLAMVSANLVNFLLTSIILAVYLLLAKMSFGYLLFFPAIVLTHVALCLGIALLLSTANVFFRDTEHILQIVTLGWFFLTPIFYPIQLQMEFLPASCHWLLFLNPMAGIICSYRAVWMSTALPAIGMVAVSFIVSWLILWIGIIVFQRFQMRFADEL